MIRLGYYGRRPSTDRAEEEVLMTLRRMIPVLATALSNLAPTAVIMVLALTGCSSHQTGVPAAPADQVEVVGTLVALKDDRPVDGGIDLTLETGPGIRQLVRVPSAYIAGPRDSILAMHQVVDAARVGDRLRARGTRDETGALRPEVIERISGPTR
jgi:hypothetical protein